MECRRYDAQPPPHTTLTLLINQNLLFLLGTNTQQYYAVVEELSRAIRLEAALNEYLYYYHVSRAELYCATLLLYIQQQQQYGVRGVTGERLWYIFLGIPYLACGSTAAVVTQSQPRFICTAAGVQEPAPGIIPASFHQQQQ